MHAPAPVADRPTDGDILITTKTGGHLVSVVPHPHRLSFASLSDAVRLARKWASANHVAVWHSAQGSEARLLPDEEVVQ
jgi:hypothetical protein